MILVFLYYRTVIEKVFQNLSASAKQDNGIKEVGKGIVSVTENVGFVAFAKRPVKYVGLCECDYAQIWSI